MKIEQIERLLEFAAIHPELVCGATRVDFHADYVEIIWSKWMHTSEQLQAVAQKHRHLEWTVERSDTASLNLDWLCDFGDVRIRLQYADAVRVVEIPPNVDFGGPLAVTPIAYGGPYEYKTP